MDDAPHPDAAELFHEVGPSIISTDESSDTIFLRETILEHSLKNVSHLTVLMSNNFEEQFIPKYLPRAFPWALNYDCGGAVYHGLFDHQDIAIAGRAPKQVWRSLEDEAVLTPADFASMLACRPEIPIARFWLLVPATRNPHWRLSVIR